MAVSASLNGTGGPLVLFLHGQPGSSADWDLVVRRLDGRADVLVPDRPGYGRSGREALGVAENAAVAESLLAGHPASRRVVVAHSWAAAVALELAVRPAARVDELVLAAPAATRAALGIGDHVLALPGAGAALALVGMRIAGTALAVPAVRRRATTWLGADDDGYFERLGRDWRGTDAWRSFSHEQRALLREAAAVEDVIDRVEVPVTVLVGGRDRVVRPSSGRTLAARLRRGRLVQVPGAGHLLPVVAPAAVTRAVLDAIGSEVGGRHPAPAPVS
jgi:pimeloyl-ACP methyl ester carboxylesterase